MDWITILLLLVAGVLALSAIITARLPQAKDVIAKIVPLQGIIGVVILVFGIIWAIRVFPHMDDLTSKQAPMSLLFACLGVVVSYLTLGFVFGMPMIAQWIPGESPAEQKALEAQRKLLPFQTVLGIVALVSAVLVLYVHTSVDIVKAVGGVWKILGLMR